MSDAYGWIEEVFSELQDFSDRLSVYMRSQIDAVLQRKIVTILGFLLRVIGRSEYLIKKGRFRHYLKIAFLAKDEKTKALLGGINKMFEEEHRYVLAVTYDKTQSIEEKVDNNTTQIKEMHQTQLDAEADDRIWRTLCNTSASDDVDEIFSRQKRSLLKGTGVWLQNEQLFEAWFEGHTTLLWVFGGPGAGKSFLSTWLVERLQEHTGRQQGHTATAHFFIKENSEILRETNNILKTLAWQLTSQDPNFKLHVANISKNRSLTITAEDTWEYIFLAYYQSSNPDIHPAVIVLDGLDEAPSPTRKTILSFLKTLPSPSHPSTPPPIQFAIIGRTSLRHDLEFSRHEKPSYIQVSKHKNHADMTRYICKRLEDVELLRTLRKKKGVKRANKVGVQLRDKILEGADGVFLWAKLLIDTIVHKDLVQIEGILNDPPADLDDMICSVFERLEKDEDLDRGLVMRMVGLCGYARRPLRFGELDLFLSLPGRRTRYLLWGHVRGKLSSVFECGFPVGYDPDEDEERRKEEKGGEIVTPQSGGADLVGIDGTDGEEFDFSGDVDEDDEEDDEDDEGDSEDEGHATPGAGTIGEPSTWSLTASSEGSAGKHLSAGQRKTVITFSHTRFKDYVVREGHPQTRRNPSSTVIPASEGVQVQLLILCLDVFRLELLPNSTPGTSDAEYLAEYPLRNLAWHLKGTDKSSISAEEFCRVVEGLYWLFGTERGAECHMKANHYYDDWHSTYNEFWHTWVSTGDNLRVVQGWFADLEHRDTKGLRLAEEERAWVIDAAQDVKVLLRPCMMKASRLWLVRDSHDSVKIFNKGEWPCWLLYGWLSLVSAWISALWRTDILTTLPSQLDKSLPSSLVAKFDSDYDMHKFGPVSEHLEAIAGWAGLEQNQHWHTMLGWILMSAGAYEEAKAHGMEAVRQDPKAWVGMETVARSHGKLLEFQDAIDWMKRSIEAIPSSIATIAGYMWPSVYDWATHLGDEATAFEAAKTGAELNLSSLPAQIRYIKALHARGDSETIVRTISKLRLVTYPTKGFSQVVNLFVSEMEGYAEIGEAFRNTGQSTWILDDMQEALQHLEQHAQTNALVVNALYAANFSYDWYDNQEDKTIEWAELFLSLLEQHPPDNDAALPLWQRWWTDKLAQLYFDKATRLFRTASGITEEVDLLADKLRALALGGKTPDGFDVFLSNHATLLWGRWLKEYRQESAVTWRKWARDMLLEDIEALCGNHPDDDAVHLRSLALALLQVGDRGNASALFAALYRPLEGSRGTCRREGEQPSEQGSGVKLERQTSWTTAPDEKSIPLRISSNDGMSKCGNCGKTTLEVAEFYVCEVCPREQWCDVCLVLVRDPAIKPGLKRHRCDAAHEMYRVWPVPDDARDVVGEYREESGEIEVKGSWLVGLGEEWLCGPRVEYLVDRLCRVERSGGT